MRGRKTSKKDSKINLRRSARRKRSRQKLSGTAELPRVTIFRSNTAMYLQLVDDVARSTIAAVSTSSKENKGKLKNTVEGAKELGKQLAAAALKKGIKQVKYDRSGYLYHGRVRAVAEQLRELGLRI